MVGIGDGFFIEIVSETAARILHPAKVMGTKEGGFVAELEEAKVSLDEGAEFQIFFEVKNKFVKQSAKVSAFFAGEPNPTIEFTTEGEPVSAECRQQFRVSTVMVDLTASLGKQTDCKLLNVSASGLSVLTAATFELYATPDASVRHEGKTYSGRVSVQSVLPMGKGQIRYGLHCVDSSGNLETGLRKMTMAIQRTQLRRLASAE